MIETANDISFDQYFQESKLLLVDFWSPTCIPCRMLEKSLEEVADLHGSAIQIIKINVNDSPKTSTRFLIRTLPTLLFIQNKTVRTQLTGAVNSKQIAKLIEEIRT